MKKVNNFIVEIVHFLNNFDIHYEMGSISVVSPISKTISKFFAALFKQLLNFRILLFLKFFAKSINKLTRGDYVSEVQLPKLDPIPKLGEMTVQCIELLVHNYYNPQRVLVSRVILMFRSQWRGGARLEARSWRLVC